MRASWGIMTRNCVILHRASTFTLFLAKVLGAMDYNNPDCDAIETREAMACCLCPLGMF